MAQIRDNEWLESSNYSPDDFEAEERMTAEQARRLEEACRRTGQSFDRGMSRDQAERKLAELGRA